MGYHVGIITTGGTDRRADYMKRVVDGALPTAACYSVNLHGMVKDYWVAKKNTKAMREIGPEGPQRFAAYMEKLAPKYHAFICYDIAFAAHVLGEDVVKGMRDTSKLAGMMTEIHGRPVLFVADPLLMYARMNTPEEHAGAAFTATAHVYKLRNKLLNVPSNTRPMKLIIPKTAEDLKACAKLAARARLIGFDIETSGGLISCIGFSCDIGRDYLPTIVIPLLTNITDTDGMYWTDEQVFNLALDTIAGILDNPVPKAAHNGAYDLTFILRYGWRVTNYVFDTMLMHHSMYPTLPRALYIGCSMYLSDYRYWKDDAKEVGEDGKVKWAAPKTPEGMMKYLTYNGQDCAYTVELCYALLARMQLADFNRAPHVDVPFDYAWHTYVRKYALEFGPAFYMSMNGLAADPGRQLKLRQKLTAEAKEKLAELRELVGIDNLNPNSPPQLANLLYDELGLKPLPRVGRSSDKRTLTKYADKHPIIKTVVEAIAAAKEPANNASKYGELPLLGGKHFLAMFKAAVTTTSRLSSAKHNLGVGTNLQNVPKSMRVFMHAPPGRILDCADYSQSDTYGVAFESQDSAMMEAITDDRDTHSVHVEFFFGYGYDEVVKGAAAKEAWVVHPITGVRQIIKKVTHGTNYDMGGDTMLTNVRRDAAVAMVKALLGSARAALFMKFMDLDSTLGSEYYIGEAALFSDQQLAKACDFAQRLYYLRYKRLKQWKEEAVREAEMTGGVIAMFGGSYTRMICAPRKNPRFVPAAYGQGFTSGNCNNALLRLYFLAQDMWDDGFDMHLQVHDEIVTSFPPDRFDLVARKKAVMETPCEIRGRTFVVPVESELAYSWDPKNMVVWDGSKTDEEYLRLIAEKEQKTLGALGMGENGDKSDLAAAAWRLLHGG